MAPISDARLRACLEPVPASFGAPPGLRDAAVLAPWFTREGRDHLLLISRRDDLPHHAGQIAFPGGSSAPGEDPVQCALREAHEEIGLEPASATILGALPPRVSIARFHVQALVARIPSPAGLRLDPREVDATFEVAWEDLCDDARWQMREIPGRGKGPHFPLGSRWLWGLTARFVRELVERTRRLEA
jgi:8-oxo-dGTP pyrophosphatase MutT (NUDIX family)